MSSLPGDQPHPEKPHQDAVSRVDRGVLERRGLLLGTKGINSQETSIAFQPPDIKGRTSLPKKEGLNFRK